MSKHLAEWTDTEIDNSIKNHEDKGATNQERYRELLEERARRGKSVLSVEVSIRHLVEHAKAGRFTTYGALAEANNVPWTRARRLLDGKSGHLDRVLEVCYARKMPLLTAICVTKDKVTTGELVPEALSGFIKAARRLGYAVTDEEAFLRKCQNECFAWAASAT